MRYVVNGGSAVLGRDVVRASGVLRFAAGANEAFISTRVLPDAAQAPRCWTNPGLRCRRFSVVVTPINGDAAIAPTIGDDAILQVNSQSDGVEVGDGLVARASAGAAVVLRVPMTLPRPATKTITARYIVRAGTAIAGAEVRLESGAIRFGRGKEEASALVHVPSGDSGAPYSSVIVRVTSVTSGTVARPVGYGIVASSGPALAAESSGNFDTATLTQVVTSAGATDAYGIAPTSDGAAVSALGNVIAPNDRLAFWPSTEAVATNEEACATWTGQLPAQAPGVLVQQGLVVRLATADGVTRAITVTKNVWGGAFDVLNVHLWDTALADPFQLVAQIDLEGYFRSVGQLALPYDVCARVVGPSLQVAFWFPGQPVPGWGAAGQGATLTLPAAWSYPGQAGFYAGHLPTGGSTTDTALYAGPPQASPQP
jgi:hypothetical protein